MTTQALKKGERSEPCERAASPSTGADWGFGGVHH
ncbi:hypothetical protein J2751_000010 [Halorubrum alkaliphilum]|uniref:Uncharacterized protein n=1 Tax=Halorubrum alkaliphilum TaxID=261290 RepID=A0A8T4GB25_9EURY|nr:hypothetical protein [Halorubrum alkaliphilum]